jgi:hypothetical protein
MFCLLQVEHCVGISAEFHRHFLVIEFHLFTKYSAQLKIVEDEECLFSGMVRRVAHLRTEVSEECSASIIRVTRINEIATHLVAACVGC